MSVTTRAGKGSALTFGEMDENFTFLDKPHFGASSADPITVSQDPANPTYLTGVTLFATSTVEFELITSVDGTLWVKNVSGETITMEGDSMWQMSQGAGGSAQLVLWSERSSDDGLTYTPNASSLRESVIANNGLDSWAVPSAVSAWLPDESIRWALYNSGSGSVTLSPPSELVNGADTVTGLSVYWNLTAV